MRVARLLGIALLVLLGVVLVWTRLVHVGESFWHDEAFSVLHHGGFTDAFGGHALYNQLSWAWTGVFGESEAMHRFWSVVPGIAAVGLGAWWGWRRLGAATAVAFAALAVAAPLHMQHVPEARGYGLAMLAATAMLIFADRLARAYSRWTLVGFLGAGLVGIWTLIFFAFSFVGQAAALLRRPDLRRPVVAGTAVVAVASFIYHRPFQNYEEVEGEVISLPAASLWERTLDWLVVPTGSLLASGDPAFTLVDHPATPGWAALAVLALVAGAGLALWRRGDFGLALLLFLPPLFFNLAFSIGGLNTVPRHQLVLLPHVLFLVAIGIVESGSLVARVRALRPLVVSAGVVVVAALSVEVMREERAEGLPRENFKGVANVVRWSEVNPVVTDSARSTGLRYYLGDGVAILPPEQIEGMLCRRRQELTYIHHPYPEPTTIDLGCLVGSEVARIRVPQRDRGYFIDIWVVRARGEGVAEEGVLG